MPQRILGIDIGSWSVKGVSIETRFRGFDIKSVQEVRVQPGVPDTKLDRQADALALLLAEPSMRADAYVAGFPGELTTTRFVTLPFHDTKRIEQTMAGELEDAVPFELSDAVFDHTFLTKLPDGGSVSLAAVAFKDPVGKFLATLQESGADPKFLPVDVLELYNLYSFFLRDDSSRAEAPGSAAPEAGTFIGEQPDGPPDARLVVDIGHERTLVLAASAKGIAYDRAIRAGGRDVTEAIAKAYSIDLEDAEAGKHADALVASSRHPAPSDAAQKMSDVCTQGLDILVKELRRALQAIRSDKRVRITRIDLVGGGARIKNLANYLAEQLNVPVANGVAVEQAVEAQTEAPRRAAHAMALALALRTSGDAPVASIDFRVGEFQFAGQLRHLKERLPILALGTAVMLVLFASNIWAQYHVITNREEDVDQQFCKISQTVLGKEVCEPSLVLSMMASPATELGTFKLPERSAFRIAADLSHAMPQGEIIINELEVTPDRVRIGGETSSFDAVDQIVSEYAKDDCFSEIKKSKLRKLSDGKGVEFQLSIKVRCS